MGNAWATLNVSVGNVWATLMRLFKTARCCAMGVHKGARVRNELPNLATKSDCWSLAGFWVGNGRARAVLKFERCHGRVCDCRGCKATHNTHCTDTTRTSKPLHVLAPCEAMSPWQEKSL